LKAGCGIFRQWNPIQIEKKIVKCENVKESLKLLRGEESGKKKKNMLIV
jgi:hypothetical protein